MDYGLWWTLLAGNCLAIVSGQPEEVAGRLTDPTFVSSTGGGEVTGSIEATVTCPDKLVPKHPHWPRLRDELLAAEWDLLLCSAGTLSAILFEHAGRCSMSGRLMR